MMFGIKSKMGKSYYPIVFAGIALIIAPLILSDIPLGKGMILNPMYLLSIIAIICAILIQYLVHDSLEKRVEIIENEMRQSKIIVDRKDYGSASHPMNMDFADLLLRRIGKYYTKESEIPTFILAILAAIIASDAIFWEISKAQIITLVSIVPVSAALMAVMWKIVDIRKTNNALHSQIEKLIILHYDKISKFDKTKQEGIIDCLDMLFSKKSKAEILEKCTKILSDG